MGPGLFAAECAGLRSSVPSTNLSPPDASNSGGGFDGYLEDARRSWETAREQRSEPWDRRDDQPVDDDIESGSPEQPDKEAVDGGEAARPEGDKAADGTVVASAVVPVVVPVAEASTEPLIEQVAVSTVREEGVSEFVEAGRGEPVGQREQQSALPGSSANATEAAVRPVMVGGVIGGEAALESSENAVLPRQSVRGEGDSRPAAQPAARSALGEAASKATDQQPSTSGQTDGDEPAPAERRLSADVRRQSDAARQRDNSEAPAKTPDRVALKADGRGEEGGLPRDSETLHELKVRKHVEGRLLGAAGDRGTNGPHGESAGVEKDRGQRTGRVAGPPSYIETVAELKAATVRTVSGSETAASLGRFLVVGADGAASTGSESGGTFRVVGAPTQVGSGGSPHGPASPVVSSAVNTAMGETPLSEAAGPDGIASAARVLSASGGGGRFQVAMQLDPPELGQMRLHIQMHQQAMTLHVDVESQAVSKLIESRLSMLRDALAVHGIRIDRTDVVVRSPNSAETGAYQEQGGQGGHDGGADEDRLSGEHSDAWGSDGERMERGDHRSEAGGDSTGETAVEQGTDVTDDPTSMHDSKGNRATTELSLDLVA